MSKQLKLRFKKIMKKAEFVHADLEYHEELIGEAEKLFHAAAQELFLRLSAEEQSRLKEVLEKKRTAEEQKVWEQIEQLKKEEGSEIEDEQESCSVEESEDEIKPLPPKSAKLKKLFYRIAERTHPDKAAASGLSAPAVALMEQRFKRARATYTEENWYVLCSIAIEIGLELEEPTAEHINWVDTDIRNTMAKIAQVSNRLTWHWYVGDDRIKQATLQHYFKQTYNFDYPSPDGGSSDSID